VKPIFDSFLAWDDCPAGFDRQPAAADIATIATKAAPTSTDRFIFIPLLGKMS
jgi:hypothetical protein